MSTTIVPAEVKLAAKRAFARTTTQAYAASLATGLPTAGAIVAFVNDQGPAKWVIVGVTVLLAVASPPLAGLRAYLNILGNGIPTEYAEATDVVGTRDSAGAIVAASAVPMPPDGQKSGKAL